MHRLVNKVGIIIWAYGPEDAPRFLLRHNRPFAGRTDEWTIAFGNVELGETLAVAAQREAREEYGIFTDPGKLCKLDYRIYYQDIRPITIHFFSLQTATIDIPIQLNEESIGYDWATLQIAKALMKHADEAKALEQIALQSK